jgi:hypothetical protein
MGLFKNTYSVSCSARQPGRGAPGVASAANTSLPVIANLAAGMQTIGKNVDSLMYWDAGHGANQDAADFITWMASTTGHKR